MPASIAVNNRKSAWGICKSNGGHTHRPQSDVPAPGTAPSGGALWASASEAHDTIRLRSMMSSTPPWEANQPIHPRVVYAGVGGWCT